MNMSRMPSQVEPTYDSQPPPVSASTASTAWLVDEPPGPARKLVEALFYMVLALGLFQTYLGPLSGVRFVVGGPILLCGALAALITLARRQPLPSTVWFYVLIAIGANISQIIVAQEMPVVGRTVAPFVIFPCYLIMVGLVVRNEVACKRLMIALSLFALLAVWTAGVELTARAGSQRLRLDKVIATTLGDANALAFHAGTLAVSVLFWSLRSAKMIRPALWFLAGVLTLVVIRTVSRSGIVGLGCGLAVLATAILLGRGVRLSGIILIIVAVCAGSVLLSTVSDSLDFLVERFTSTDLRETVRLRVYSWETVIDLLNTMVLGRGPFLSETFAGIHAHNAYIYTQLTYGGITAMPYLAMLAMMGIRTFRLVRDNGVPRDIRLWVLALFGMTLLYQMTTNMGYVGPESILAFAVIERYTAPYSRRRLEYRKWLGRQAGLALGPYGPELSSPYR